MPGTSIPYPWITGLSPQAQQEIERNFLHVQKQIGDIEGHTLVVAASNSLDPARADYRCSGTDDQNTINEAIAALPTAGGRIVLLEGTYTLSGAVVYNNATGYFTLQGQGHASILGGSGQFTRLQIDAHAGVQLYDFAVTIDTGSPSATGIKITAAPGDLGNNLLHNVQVHGSGDNGSGAIIIGVEGTVQATEIVGIISNCQLRTNGSAGESPSPGIAIYGQPWHVMNNYVRGFSTGITMNAMDYVVIVGNHVHASASGSTTRNALVLRGVANSVVAANDLRSDSPGIPLALDVSAGTPCTNNIFSGNRLHTAGTPTLRPVIVTWESSGHTNNLFVGTHCTGGDAGDTTGLNPIPAAGSGSVAYHTFSTVPGDIIDGNHAPGTHTHTSGSITDFSEAVDDRVAALLVAGSNITLTYNDGANTLTVASVGAAGAQDVKDFTHDFMLMGG